MKKRRNLAERLTVKTIAIAKLENKNMNNPKSYRC